MRTRGWQGDPPADDDAARARIIEATMRCVDRHGSKTGLSDIAAELGVTRQTVYRYFSSTEDVLIAAGRVAAGSFVDRGAAHVAGITDPTEHVVESIAFTIEQLPREHRLTMLLSTGHADRFARTFTSATAMALTRAMLDRAPIDWRAIGYSTDDLDDLAEFSLRVIGSFVLAPGGTPRDGAALRRFLYRWVGPAIERVTAGR